MATPGEDTVTGVYNFSAGGQSMWGPGNAASIDDNLTLVGFSTGNKTIGPIAGVTLSGSLGAALVAVVSGTAGGVSIDYPVSATITAPTAFSPGEQFTVDTTGTTTSALAHSSASITTQFPTFSASLDLDVSGSVGASGELDILGITTPAFSASTSFDDDITLLSAVTSGSQTYNFPDNLGSVTFSIPTTESGSTVVNGGVALPSISALETASPAVIGASTDLAQDLAQLADIEDFPTASFLDGAVSYNLLSAPLSGAIDLVQNFTFVPTAVSVEITTPWHTSETVPLGGKATFTVPSASQLSADGLSGSSTLSLTTDYILSGYLEDQTGIKATVTIEVDALSASIFGESVGPLYTATVLSANSSPLYLYEPGGSAGFPLENITTPSTTVDVGLNPNELITVPGGGTETVSGFSADSLAVIQSGIDKVSGRLSGTNVYSGGSTAVSASGKLNIEITTSGGTFTLPNGFLVGILQPGVSGGTLIDNTTTGTTGVVLAAVPGAGQVDTLSATHNGDTLVGAQAGNVDFDIDPSFSGVIGGVMLGDQIDLEDVGLASGATVTFNSSTNLLSVKDGGYSGTIHLDTYQNLSGMVFSLESGGTNTTDIYFGIVVSNSHPGAPTQVYAGTTDSGFVVLEGGTLLVEPGGTAVNTALSGGGLVSAMSGSTMISTTVNAYAEFNLSGHASDTVINNAGGEFVGPGGTDTGAAINSGGFQYLSDGGKAIGAVVSFGGTQTVAPSGLASNTSVAGFQGVSGGAAISTHVLKGGTEALSMEAILSGGKVVSTDPGVATGTIVSAGGTLIVSGGTEVAYPGGSRTVQSWGGTAIDPQLSSGATFTVDAHAVVSGGVAYGQATISGTATVFGVQKGGIELVASKGVTISTIVDSGGTAIISKGAVAQGAQIQSGGTLIVSAGGTETSGTGGPTSDMGNENVYGFALSTFVGTSEGTGKTYAALTVLSGGTSEDPTVFRDGDEVVDKGGRVISATVGSAGTLELQSGAVVTGDIDIHGGTLQVDGTTLTNPISGLLSTDGTTLVLPNVSATLGATVSLTKATSVTDTLTISDGGHAYHFTVVSGSANDSPSLTQTEAVEFAADPYSGSQLTMLGGGGESLAAASSATLYSMPNDTVDASFASDTTIHTQSGTTVLGGPSDTIYLVGGGQVIENPLSEVYVSVGQGGSHGSGGAKTSATVPVVHDTVYGFTSGTDFISFSTLSGETISGVLHSLQATTVTSGGHTISGTIVTFDDHSTVTVISYTPSQVTSGFFKY